MIAAEPGLPRHDQREGLLVRFQDVVVGRDRPVDEGVAREAAIRQFHPVEDEHCLLARLSEVSVGQEAGERFVEVPLEDHPVIGVHVRQAVAGGVGGGCLAPGSAREDTMAPGNSLSAVALITLAETQYWAASLRLVAALAPGKRPGAGGGRRRNGASRTGTAHRWAANGVAALSWAVRIDCACVCA